MKNWWNILCAAILSHFLLGCVDPYDPPVLSETPYYLVVEGFLANGDHTNIRLSRISRLSEAPEILTEAGAFITIESKGGISYPLDEGFSGNYASQKLDLDPLEQYRLYIRTAEGQEYLSDYVTIKQTPQIDSISWDYRADGVHLYVSTHDPLNNTRYYRWEYEETWEYKTPYTSYVAYIDKQMVTREPMLPKSCWQQEQSSNILLGSSTRLDQDIIFKHPITVIPNGSWKLSRRYSILVKQYALSREAFEYYQQMLRNTEQMGSIFDPQPTELWGNIHRIDAANEPVIGFFGAGSVKEMRIYIDNRDLRRWNYRVNCGYMEFPLDSADFYLVGTAVPLTYDERTRVVTAVNSYDCIDCSTKANPIKPDFWE